MSYAYNGYYGQPSPVAYGGYSGQASPVSQFYSTQYLQHPPAVPQIYSTQYLQQPPALPVSSYSSLSGALDPQAVSTRPRSSSVHRYSQSGHQSGPNPYRSAHHESSIRRRKSSMQMRPDGPYIPQRRKDHPLGKVGPPDSARIPVPGLMGPTNHILVPQKTFRDIIAKDKAMIYRNKPITFQAAGFCEAGLRVDKVVHRDTPPIEGKSDKVLEACGFREIKIKILWPGYSHWAFEKRLKTLNGEIDRETVLVVAACAVSEFTTHIQQNKTKVSPGYEEWAIGTRPDGSRGYVGSELFVSALVHRGGSYWQPEIWAPRKF